MKTTMINYSLKIFLAVISANGILLLFRFFANEQNFLVDAGGLSAFASIFGVLYGIIAAFILFTVWSQFNSTSQSIDTEANALKQLYRFVLYLKDEGVQREIYEAIKNYTKSVIEKGMKSTASGQRDPSTSDAFNQIFLKLRLIQPRDAQEQTIFDHILKQYKETSDFRTKRLNESTARLPAPLKIFLQVASLTVVTTFAFPIFQNLSTAIFTMTATSALTSLLLLVILDLDNPFVGFWNLTAKPFERFLEYMEKE